MLQHCQPGQRFKLFCDPEVKGTVLRKSDCSVTVKVSGGIRDVEFEDPKTGEKRTFRAEGGRTTNWSPNTEVIAEGDVGEVPADDAAPTIKRRGRGKTAEPGPAPAPHAPAAPPPGSEAQEPVGPPAAPAEAPSTPNPAPTPPAAPAADASTPKPKPKPAATRKPAAPAPAPEPPKAPTTPKEGKMSALDAAEKVLGEEAKPLTAKELVDIMAAKGYWSSPGGKTPHATLNSAIMRKIKDKGDDSRFAKHPEGGFTLSIL